MGHPYRDQHTRRSSMPYLPSVAITQGTHATLVIFVLSCTVVNNFQGCLRITYVMCRILMVYLSSTHFSSSQKTGGHLG